MRLNGRLGQVIGPFDSGVDLLADGGAISELTPETTKPVLSKLGIQAAKGTIVNINGISIKIGKTGIYELDEVVNVKSLIFPNGADENTIVDFVY
jgi:hypothetical protein